MAFAEAEVGVGLIFEAYCVVTNRWGSRDQNLWVGSRTTGSAIVESTILARDSFPFCEVRPGPGDEPKCSVSMVANHGRVG